MTTPPVRTPEQRTESLAEGRRIVEARATIKRQLKAGDISIADIIDIGDRGVGDPVIGRMRIGQVLRAVPRVGNVRSARLLEQIGVDAKTHLDDLRDEHRAAIIAALS